MSFLQNSLGMSNLGNTSGNTGVVSGSAIQMIFAGGNNITLSQSLNGLSGSITISAGAAGGFSGGVSNIGNTLGDTKTIASQIVFVGGNNVTLSQSTNGASASVTISGLNMMSVGISNIGNTSGNSGMQSAQLVFAGGNNITLSQNTAANGLGTITVSGINPGAQNMSFWQNMGVNGSATDAMGQTGITYNQLGIFQLDIGNNIFPGNMTVSSIFIDVTGSVSVSIGNYSLSCLLGFYVIAGSNLSLVNSGSVSIGTAIGGTGSGSVNHQSLLNGKRYVYMATSNFSSALNMSQGLYYGALLWISSSNSASLSMYGAILGESGQRSGTLGSASVNNTFVGAMPFMGVWSATTIGFPSTIGSSHIRKTALADIFIPHIMFNNIQSSF